MKLTYHPTLELAPNAICLQKCWTRAWIEITFSLTSWPTCTVLDSSFGRLLGDVYQEVSNSDTVGAITDSLFLTGSQSYHFFHTHTHKKHFIFLFISVYAVTILPGNDISHFRIIFDCLFLPPTTAKSLVDTLSTSFAFSKINTFYYMCCLISLKLFFQQLLHQVTLLPCPFQYLLTNLLSPIPNSNAPFPVSFFVQMQLEI